MNSNLPLNAARVAHFRREIQSGRFHVNARRIADRLIADARIAHRLAASSRARSAPG